MAGRPRTRPNYSPSLPLNSGQLSASSKAASKYGVPVNIVRGVTSFLYGKRATTGNYENTAITLQRHYRAAYQQSGNALTSWQDAAAATMPGASPLQIVTATGTQSTVITGSQINPALVDILDPVLNPARLGIPRDIYEPGPTTDQTGISGTSTSDTTTTGAPKGSEPDNSGTGRGGSATSRAGTAAKAALGGAAAIDLLGGIGSTLDFLKWIAWLFHPLNLLRAVEFLTGIATMFYGVNILMKRMTRSSATHHTGVRDVFNWTPLGKANQMRRARRRGRRAGEVQAERDVAYRGARQERARSVGAHQRRLSESTGGTGGTGGLGGPGESLT